MAQHKTRTPVELARYFFVLTTFGVIAWMALAFAVLQSPDDPAGVQEKDLVTSVWLSQYEALNAAVKPAEVTQLAGIEGR